VRAIPRLLGLDAAKWARVGPESLWSAVALVATASFVMALNRFGGLIVDTPRSFLRLMLVGIWGWLGLALAIWLIINGARTLQSDRDEAGPPPSLQINVAALGLAHTPVLALGIVILVAAGLLEVLGPGFVAAVFVFGFWFPAGLIAATAHANRLAPLRAAVVVAVPYLIWMSIIGRHLLDRIQHLL
jgi:hypothetical protein